MIADVVTGLAVFGGEGIELEVPEKPLSVASVIAMVDWRERYSIRIDPEPVEAATSGPPPRTFPCTRRRDSVP